MSSLQMSDEALKYRPSAVDGKEGALYYQIIHDRDVRRVNTRHRIYADEWDESTGTIINHDKQASRYKILNIIISDTRWCIVRFNGIVKSYGTESFSIDLLVDNFEGNTEDGKGVFDFIHRHSERLKSLGRIRCAETLATSLRSFMRFRDHVDLDFGQFDKDLMVQYESWLRANDVTRNTSSFYMRNLRAAYNAAIENGLTSDLHPFSKVYTGVDKTVKRAISKDDFRKIKALNLDGKRHLQLARDLFLMSFYMRGMSFVDMAYLKKKDLIGGYIVYRRKKTGQQLTIEWTEQMQEIVGRYRNDTRYLLPIITKEDGTEREQYQNQLSRLNRNLKTIGELAGIAASISSYTSRHGWATIARELNVPISIISQGLGHDNEKTTQIYLDSIKTEVVDKANRLITGDL